MCFCVEFGFIIAGQSHGLFHKCAKHSLNFISLEKKAKRAWPKIVNKIQSLLAGCGCVQITVAMASSCICWLLHESMPQPSDVLEDKSCLGIVRVRKV